MAEVHMLPTETTIDGPRTKRWELGAEECAALGAHRIARLGIHDVAAPYRRVRQHPGGSFLLACTEGRGQVLLDGRWQVVRAGTVCMAPPRVLNAFAAVPGYRWSFVWVRYDEPAALHPLVGASSPVRVRTDVTSLKRVMEGLRAEWSGRCEPQMLHHWAELLQGHIRRLAQPWQSNERLGHLWSVVGRDLAQPWDLGSLAARCHMSKENLRRLCLRELGRSPMQQVAYMRMRCAQEMLESASDKLEVVARAVGYDGALVFSRAFKRLVGCNPSEYRNQGARGPRGNLRAHGRQR